MKLFSALAAIAVAALFLFGAPAIAGEPCPDGNCPDTVQISTKIDTAEPCLAGQVEVTLRHRRHPLRSVACVVVHPVRTVVTIEKQRPHRLAKIATCVSYGCR
jgi:hypothetical protein